MQFWILVHTRLVEGKLDTHYHTYTTVNKAIEAYNSIAVSLEITSKILLEGGLMNGSNLLILKQEVFS